MITEKSEVSNLGVLYVPAQDQCQACWDELSSNSLFQAHLPANWCCAIPFIHAQVRSPLPNCKRGAAKRTADHVLIVCLIHQAPHGAQGLTVLDDETQCWLNNITASI